MRMFVKTLRKRSFFCMNSGCRFLQFDGKNEKNLSEKDLTNLQCRVKSHSTAQHSTSYLFVFSDRNFTLIDKNKNIVMQGDLVLKFCMAIFCVQNFSRRRKFHFYGIIFRRSFRFCRCNVSCLIGHGIRGGLNNHTN